jgi:hypothetical protein
MKRIAIMIAATLLAGTSQAAVVTINVTGVLGDWYTKIAPPGNPIFYQTFLVGNPDINVQGSVSYDDTSLELTALSLSQVGTLVADVNNNTPSSPGVMTISGLQWGLVLGPTSWIDQLAGSASCTGSSVACSTVAGHINSMSNLSPFQFDGVKKGFKVGGITQIAKQGYVETIEGTTDVWIDVFADETYSPNPGYNAIHNQLFQLTETWTPPVEEVPVPAAAWLMGSGLMGLAGIARRRRS